MQKQKPKLIKPDISVLSVEPKYIDKFWPLCDFMIAEALKYSGGFADAKDIKDLLKKDEAQMFLVFGSDEEELKRHLWGDKIVNTVTKFAKLNGCKKLSFWVRPGWSKVSKKWGWKAKHIQMEKDL